MIITFIAGDIISYLELSTSSNMIVMVKYERQPVSK